MPDDDTLEAGKPEILEYARSVAPAGRRITELRWGVPGPDGVSLLAQINRGLVLVTRLTETAIRTYWRDVHLRGGVQREIRGALQNL